MAPLSSSLFDRVVAASGLAEVFAADSIARVCTKAGIPGRVITRDNLPQLIPHLKPVLKIFLGADEADRRIASIEAFVHE